MSAGYTGCTSRFDHITPTLINLHWLPVKSRIDFKLLLIVFKALHGLAPDYLIELINIKSPSNYNIRSNRELLLEPPSVKTLATLGDRSLRLRHPCFGTPYLHISERLAVLTVLKDF